MLVLGQAESQDQQETTTNKRVERDVDMQEIPQGPVSPGHFADMAKPFKDGMDYAMGAASDFVSKAKDAIGGGAGRRRRDSNQQ